MHTLLQRQLRRVGLSSEAAPTDPAAWSELLARVSDSYEDVDRERYMMERSLSISSREMQELYEELKRVSDSQLAAERDRLARSLAILDATLNTMSDGVLVVAEDRSVVMFNQSFVEMWRIPQEIVATRSDAAMLGQVFSSLARPEEFLARVEALYNAPGESSRDEIALVDGRVFDRYSAPVIAADGSNHGRMWLFRDVTGPRASEVEIRRVNRFLDSIIENLPDMLFVKDAERLSFVRFNRAGEELLGLSRESLIGKTDFDFFPPEQAQFFVDSDRGVLEERRVVEILDEPIETRDNGTRRLHTKKIPICDEDGTPRYLLGISRDVTELKHAENELRQAKEAAESASRAKSQFLSNMSHELRTPLNAILGFSRVLSSGSPGALNARQETYVQYVLQAGDHILRLIDDLLDLRRIEEKGGQLERVVCELQAVVDGSIGMVLPLIGERGHALRIEIPAGLPHVRCDPTAVRQVLVNLLANAAKFTPKGGQITLQARDEGALVRVNVTDNGVGIAPEDQGVLFNYFVQVGAKHRHHMKGSGVGLALTRALVEEMGGTMSVESVPNEGSVFGFTLPVAELDLQGTVPSEEELARWP